MSKGTAKRGTAGSWDNLSMEEPPNPEPSVMSQCQRFPNGSPWSFYVYKLQVCPTIYSSDETDC